MVWVGGPAAWRETDSFKHMRLSEQVLSGVVFQTFLVEAQRLKHMEMVILIAAGVKCPHRSGHLINP